MPWFGYHYRNRSAERRAWEEREARKRQESWERMKADVARKHARLAG